MPDVDRPLVVHLVHRFSVGGLENGIVNLVNGLPENRWRHAIVALTEVDKGFASRILRDDVRFASLNKPPGQGLWLYRRLWRLFRTWKPAVLHTRNLGTLEFHVPAWAAGVPARVHGEHGRDVDDLHGTNRRHIAMRRLYRPFVQHQIALGRSLADYLRDTVGVSEARLSTVYNGVDTVRFSPGSTAGTPIPGCPFVEPGLWKVGTVGRMQAVKAQTLLARAFVDLLQRRPALRAHLRLVMVGDGPLRAECQAILLAGGVSDLAWLPGERSDVPDVMRGLDCFVLPSLAEGISNTILEAMASGLPVLATDVGSNAELLDGEACGLVVPAGSAGPLVDGLERLAADAAAAAALGRAARTRVERHFSLPAMLAGYEAVYERLLGAASKE